MQYLTSRPTAPLTCQTPYLGGVSPDEYILKVSNIRGRSSVGAKPTSKRRLILMAQRNENDLALYFEGAVALPADGSTANVVSFTVPSGFDAIITSVRNTWSGNGFQNGQGLLSWRYRVGGGYIMNRGGVTFQNTAADGYQLIGSGGAFAYENQQVIIEADAAVGANAALTGGVIECQVFGWYLPKS